MNIKLTNGDIDKLLENRSIVRFTDYMNAKTPLSFKCLICDYVWETLSRNVCNRGTGCPRCASRVLTADDIDNKLINKNIKRVGEYINNKTRVKFQCLVKNCNHVWESFVGNILTHNHGCPKCSKNAKLTNEEIDKKLSDRNIIRVGNYINAQIPLMFECLKCENQWETCVGNVLRKNSNCPKCVNVISRPEELWLLYLNIPNDPAHRQVKLKIDGRKIRVDGFDPSTNTIYEFYGDYYHGNPEIFAPNAFNQKVKKTFGELYQLTLEKEALIYGAGYNLITIWEHNFKMARKQNVPI